MATSSEILATVILGIAVLQSLTVSSIAWRPRSRALHFFLFDLEGIFAIWAALYLTVISVIDHSRLLDLVSHLHFQNVFVVACLMYIFSGVYVRHISEAVIRSIARRFRGPANAIFLVVALVVVPLSGSVITEPAAIAILAVVLRRHFFASRISVNFKYALLATMFVNVSIGGLLTPFAAPPVVVVANTWGWGLEHMLLHFGWKSIEACFVSAVWLATHYRKEIASLEIPALSLKWPRITKPSLRAGDLRSAFAVALFLSAVLVLSADQGWWVSWTLARVSNFALYVATIFITGVVDNAAITALASRENFLTGDQKYLVVAASVVGGGLTLIANAPNLIGFSIVRAEFIGDHAAGHFSAMRLFRAALVPTLIAAIAFSVF